MLLSPVLAGDVRPGGLCLPATRHAATRGTEQAVDPEPRPRRRPPSSTSGSARGLQRPLGGDGAPGSARQGERNHSRPDAAVSTAGVAAAGGAGRDRGGGAARQPRELRPPKTVVRLRLVL